MGLIFSLEKAPIIPMNYGYLYNGYAVQNSLFAPSGWHVPTSAEINTLSTFLGGDSVSGGALKETGTTYWTSPNTGATNSSGFTAYASGMRLQTDGSFDSINMSGLYWTSNFETGYLLESHNDDLLQVYVPVVRGYAVRLIKDDSNFVSSLTDADGNVYPTVQIGTQIGTARNWKCKKLRDNTPIPEVTNNASWMSQTTMARCVYDNNEANA